MKQCYDGGTCANEAELEELQAAVAALAEVNDKLRKELEVWEFEVGSTCETRLAAADALAEAMEPLSHFLDTFKNEADNLALWFYSDGTGVVTVGDFHFRRVANALREYREVSGG